MATATSGYDEHGAATNGRQKYDAMRTALRDHSIHITSVGPYISKLEQKNFDEQDARAKRSIRLSSSQGGCGTSGRGVARRLGLRRGGLPAAGRPSRDVEALRLLLQHPRAPVPTHGAEEDLDM